MEIGNIQLGDKFRLTLDNGVEYTLKFVNINNFRCPEEKYAADVTDQYGNFLDDLFFFGDDFLYMNADRIMEL